MTFLKKLGNFIKQKLYPPRCIFCRCVLEDGVRLCICADCSGTVEKIPSEHCPICGRSTHLGSSICWKCNAHPPYFQSHRSVYYYKGRARKTICLFKFCRKKHYGSTMSMIMSGYAYFGEPIDAVTWVPTTKRNTRTRGYNQSEVLARGISELMKLPCVESVVKTRPTKPQKTLNFEQRMRNLSGSFSATENAKGKTLLLVDDIMTTGATLNTVSKTLRRGGAKRIYCLTFASTDDKI